MAAVLTVLNISSRGRVLSSQVRKPPAEVAAWLEQCTEQVLFKAFIDPEDDRLEFYCNGPPEASHGSGSLERAKQAFLQLMPQERADFEHTIYPAGRPCVGDRVLVTTRSDERYALTGKVVEDDGSDQPFRLEFADAPPRRDGDEDWYSEKEVRGEAGFMPPPPPPLRYAAPLPPSANGYLCPTDMFGRPFGPRRKDHFVPLPWLAVAGVCTGAEVSVARLDCF